jgi:hypothetical protein
METTGTWEDDVNKLGVKRSRPDHISYFRFSGINVLKHFAFAISLLVR